jgi:hypothetical protein
MEPLAKAKFANEGDREKQLFSLGGSQLSRIVPECRANEHLPVNDDDAAYCRWADDGGNNLGD